MGDIWDPLKFLIGTWNTPVSGQPGEGVTGSTTFSYQLDQKVILRNSRTEFAPEPGQKDGVVHEDLLVIYAQPGDPHLRAIYFDNEGHIIHYVVLFPDRQPGVIFESEGTDRSPRARLVYEMDPDGTLGIEFFVAAPGGELVSHVKGTMNRQV